MRADAARRRALVVRAARRLVAEGGGDVALDAVAAAAGVGIATLYRNFDSRAALLDAVAVAILDDIRAAAQEASEAIAHDGGASWEQFVRRLVDLDLGALGAALAGYATTLSAPVREAQDAAWVSVDALLAAARSAGLVRDDLGAVELVVAVGTVTRPQPESLRRVAPALEETLVSILIAGIGPQRG